MKQKLLSKVMLLLFALVAGSASVWAQKITDYKNIISGRKYYIGATTSGTDYYLSVNGSSTSTSIAGTAVLKKADATPFLFEGSSTSWTIKFESGYYLSLKDGKDNGKVQVVEAAATFTASNQSSKLRLTIGNYSIQKNNSGTQFGSYGNTQTDIWLEEVVDASPLASIAVDASGATTVFHVGDTFTHEGAIVTATYENASTKDVTADATFSTPDMSSAGTKTVTVSYTENEVEKTTSYDITVNAPATLTSISLSGTYPTEFTQGDTFSSEGIVVTANYDDETTSNVTENATFSGYDMSTAGDQTVTVSYGGKTATYDITVNAYVQPTDVTVNMNYTWLGSSNGGNLSSDKLPVVKNEENITITITDGGSNRPRGDADYIRVYKGSTIKFEAPSGYNITEIVFTTGGNNTWNAPSVDTGTLSEKTWTGETTEVTFTLSGSCFIASAAITLEAPKTLSSIALSGTYPTVFHTGDTFSHEGMTVTATYDNESTKDVTASATFTGYNMGNTGAQTVTVSYTENEVTKTATYDITVNAPATLTSITLSGTYPTEFEQGDDFSSEGIVVTANYDDETTSNVTGEAMFSGYDMSTLGEQTVTVTYNGKTATYDITVAEKKGTEGRPYTVAEAIAYINTLGSSTSAEEVYVSGIISQVDSYNSTYSSIQYWISDDGTTTGQMEVYSGKGLDGADFSSVDDLAVGYVVTVKGYVKMYKSTPEFDKNNQLASLSTTRNVTLNASGYATFACNCALDFTDDSEFSAWQITGVSGTSITFLQITETVKAGTGVLLKGTASATVNIPVAASGTDISGTNKLVGITTATAVADNAYYGLSGDEFVKVNAGTVPAGKALLPASEVPASVRGLSFVFDNADGIVEMRNGENETMRSEVFDLSGRRVVKPTKGLYIVNGKKIMVK